jgi:DNA-binding MarR family transcriptional regulator
VTAPTALTELILEVFRLNGRLLEAGDALVADLGLTSARWQVLGAIDAAAGPLPVAHIARNMGLSRQAVQRLANEMEADGFVRFAVNPHHERAKLVTMTEAGEAAFRRAMRKQARWAEALAEAAPRAKIEAAAVVLRALRDRLETE